MVRRGRARSTALEPVIHQLPWRQVENSHGPLPILDPEGVERIHEASLRVLEELGIELWSAEARKLFADAGASVDGEIVRVGRDVIEAALVSAPRSFTLTSRNPEKALEIGGQQDRVRFGRWSARRARRGERAPLIEHGGLRELHPPRALLQCDPHPRQSSGSPTRTCSKQPPSRHLPGESHAL